MRGHVRGRGHCLFAASLLAAIASLASIVSGCASVAGTSIAPATLSVVPAAVDFKAVIVGQKNSQTLAITNTSHKTVDLKAARVSGTGFALASGKIPAVLAPGASFRMTVVFSPVSTATVDGALTLYSPDFREPLRVSMSGAGEKAAPAMQTAPNPVSFGTRAISSSTFQTVTLKNTGNVALKIGASSMLGGAFSISGLSAGVSLEPGQQLSFQIWFRPAGKGSWSDTLSISSSSLPSPVKVAISGSASTTAVSSPSNTTAHSVTLDWNASSSSVAGYHIYRGNTSGGPYNRINASLVTAINFSDLSVVSGSRYFYVVTAVEGTGTESAFSNEVSAEIPD